MVYIPSPAVAVVGRHNSGKTTLVERLIAELVARGLDVGSVKHHSHAGFDIDYPGKDSYRHRAAGAREAVIAAPGQMACIKSIEGELECADIVRGMPGHDIVVVERGAYRAALGAGSLDTSACELAASGASDDVLGAPGEGDDRSLPSGIDCVDIVGKLPTASTVAVVTDIDEARRAAVSYGVPAFDPDDVRALADFLEQRFARPRVTVVIQAGGESRRMGRSKATVAFAGRPLICRLVERLAPAADELIITTNEPENLEFLKDRYPEHGIRLVPDARTVRGALPGLYTALLAASNPYVAVVACDMVFASASLVVAESLAMNESGADAVVPSNKHGFEPFHALYRRAGCLSAVQAALDRGEKRAQAFFSEVNVCEFPQERVLEAEPMGGCFINANTPEELRSIEESFLGK